MGDATNLLPDTVKEQFAGVIKKLPVAEPYDATTLPRDLPKEIEEALARVGTGKINLNSDGLRPLPIRSFREI